MDAIYLILYCERLKLSKDGFFDLGNTQFFAWADNIATAREIIGNDRLNDTFIKPYPYAIIERVSSGQIAVCDYKEYFQFDGGFFSPIPEPKGFEDLENAIVW